MSRQSNGCFKGKLVTNFQKSRDEVLMKSDAVPIVVKEDVDDLTAQDWQDDDFGSCNEVNVAKVLKKKKRKRYPEAYKKKNNVNLSLDSGGTSSSGETPSHPSIPENYRWIRIVNFPNDRPSTLVNGIQTNNGRKTGVSISLTTIVGTGSLYFLHQNDYELSSIGLIRFTRAGITASKIIIDYKWNLFGKIPETKEYNKKIKECHQRGADRLLDLAKANGGVFIKVGQHVAALIYLLPEEYTSTLAVLHSKAPESDLNEVKKVFKDSVGKELTEVFSSFNPKPVGVASLAQVHEAYLSETNERVAVKIQHPKVKARSLVDIKTMEFFVKIATTIFPDVKLMWLIEEVQRNLPKELDFLHEAHNADRVRRMFSHLKFLKIPTIYYNLSSDKVLTMEFCDGNQINDLDYYKKENIDPYDVCKKIGRLYSEMIFIKGYVHCDPHPGNVLIKKNTTTKITEIILLDHGLYSTLSDEFRIDYCKLWNALLKPDKNEIKRICMKMNVGDLYDLFACMVTSRSWKSVTSGVHKSKPSKQEMVEVQEFAASLIPQISQVLDQMPNSMLLILKTNDLLRAIERSLGVSNRKEGFLEMARCCTWSCYDDEMKNTISFKKQINITINLFYTLTKIYIAEWIFYIQRMTKKQILKARMNCFTNLKFFLQEKLVLIKRSLRIINFHGNGLFFDIFDTNLN
uniref:ABC1 atypical kinase-like domain-containing protein n=1 Tax=Panagrolaimus sp. JU765 TaxID=591449 RepID=A0AC34RRZ2_9BILA